MKQGEKIYTVFVVNNLAALTNTLDTFVLNLPSQIAKVKNIIVAYDCYLTNPQFEDASNDPRFPFIVELGGVAGVDIANHFIQTAGAGVVTSGNNIWINKAGQSLYDGFFISNILPLSITCRNISALDSVVSRVHVSIGLEVIERVV